MMRPLRKTFLLLMVAVLGLVGVSVAQDNPDGFPVPELVVIPGSLQSELGCPEDWQPDCTNTALTQDADSGLWVGTFDIPAGSYAYKVALDGSWDRNYGAGGVSGGPDIPLELEADTSVTFTYDHSAGLVTDSVNGAGAPAEEAPAAPVEQAEVVLPTLVNVPGTIQPQLGCPGEWQPECEASALALVEEYGIYERTHNLTAGSYMYKVALNGSWDVNFGGFADPGGPDIPLTLAADQAVTFLFDPATNWVMDDVRHQIVTAPGTYQDDIGCAADNDPACMLSWLKDVDGDGIYTLSTTAIPAGDYETQFSIGRAEASGDVVSFSVPADGETVTFAYDSAQGALIVSVGGASISGADLRARTAHWVSVDTIAWEVELAEGTEAALLYSADASLSVGLTGISGSYETLPLTVNPDGLPEAASAKFPHLAGYTALTLDAEAVAAAPEMVRGQVAVATFRNGNITSITGLQIPGVLDDLYAYDGDLGVTFDADGVPTLTVWAPTAQTVSLNLFADSDPRTDPTVIEMTRDDAGGAWSVTGEADWVGQFYTYNVTVFAPTDMAIVTNEVTDPYSVSLAQNSTRGQIVDLNSPDLMPDGWDTLEKPSFGEAFEDITLYELHVRDFSIFDESVPEEMRGTYLAFTVPDSAGMQHLAGLAEAGLTHLHLLPSFDIATINENRERHREPDYEVMASFPPDSDQQQAIIDADRDRDGFNWGYDPYHFMVPEGSYATQPDGAARIVEYRQMVQGLADAGLMVVQDVVFNHTNASGQNPRSVLDQVVPGYYHRLDATGNVTRSTCCENTATEHDMMRRLMVDTVVLNVIHYKIDAFRFDLMGHHMLEDMIAVREALDALTVEEHGVDGTRVYLYGEGWNFGEVADNARGVNATQINAAGTGIGTFNDRLRDAVRGGSPFGGRDEQGLGNGIYTDPNGVNPVNEDLARALDFADRVRVGLAGNLRDYTFMDSAGEMVTGADIDYNGSPAGYTLDPQENIIYVSKHDNETLFDNLLFRIPADTTLDEVVRMQNLSLSYVIYAQGVPFLHAGSDMLRSKSLDRNSYNSGDWFNRLDFTYQTNNFGVGLPPAADNSSQWDIMRPILANPDYLPTTEDILLNRDVVREMLRIRYSSPLFRLQTAEDVQARVIFHNTGPDQIPGVIVMELSDVVGDDLDAQHDRIVVVFNGADETVEFTAADFAGLGFTLHPVQQASADVVAQGAAFDAETGTFSVPALTTAVFVLPQE